LVGLVGEMHCLLGEALGLHRVAPGDGDGSDRPPFDLCVELIGGSDLLAFPGELLGLVAAAA
jgi:hypothetical protein